MRRSVPLLRSDYIFEPIGQQGHTYGLAQWLPFFGTGDEAVRPLSLPKLHVRRHIRLLGTCGTRISITTTMRKVTERVAGRRSVLPRRLLSADAVQPRKERLDGLAIRSSRNRATAWSRRSAATSAATRQRRSSLQGLDPAATYEVTDLDVGTPAKLSGKSLMEEGLAVEIKDKPGAAVITYQAREIGLAIVD